MSCDIAVVVPTFQRALQLPPLLLTLAEQTLAPERFEVIVVDDCSTDDTAVVVAEWAAKVPYRLRYLRTAQNGGPAAARNLGWQQTPAPFVAFTDDDCVPTPRWLEAGLAAFSARPDVGLVQGRTTVPEGVSIEHLSDWYAWRVIDEATGYFEGCNLFFRRDALEITGGFDEEIAYHGEDCAAGWRVVEAGLGHTFCAEAAVSHPVELRGMRWHIEMGRLERRIVWCAAKHPGYRRTAFWRPWAYRREDPALVAALAGLALSLRFRPALLLVLPYLWWQRPSVRHLTFFRLCLQVPVVDAVRVAAHIRGSLEHGIFVL
ncbi:MAG TPA: glycosyltransferase family 2 protein [Acidimicrobiales bacterium]|nr:glycosyltransferase family 2 protein [Acidimicrobiales bacterium]